MAIDFPSSPTNLQFYTYGNRTWQYTTALTAWTDVTQVYPTFQTNFVVTGLMETATTVASAATGTINFNATTGTILYYTVNATGNFTLNFRASASVTLNTLLAIGQSITYVFMNTNGVTPFYASAITIDGVSVTPKWVSAIVPSAGNASAIDVYSYNIVKTATSTYTVFAAQNYFA